MRPAMTRQTLLARLWLLKFVLVLAIAVIGGFVLYRMHEPSLSSVCDHIAELAPNSLVQPKIDRAFAEVAAAAKETSPAARCEAYFTTLRDDPHGGDHYSEQAGCVLAAKTLSSVAACLDK
jgi:hypothetical protein